MYQIIYQEENKIEISIRDELTVDDFKQVIHQLESLCTSHTSINVLFDAAGLKKYDFKIVIKEYDFFTKYKSYLKRVALVSDRQFEKFLVNIFSVFTDIEFKTFKEDQIAEARKWIFPSRLP